MVVFVKNFTYQSSVKIEIIIKNINTLIITLQIFLRSTYDKVDWSSPFGDIFFTDYESSVSRKTRLKC